MREVSLLLLLYWNGNRIFLHTRLQLIVSSNDFNFHPTKCWSRIYRLIAKWQLLMEENVKKLVYHSIFHSLNLHLIPLSWEFEIFTSSKSFVCIKLVFYLPLHFHFIFMFVFYFILAFYQLFFPLFFEFHLVKVSLKLLTKREMNSQTKSSKSTSMGEKFICICC